MLTGTLLRYDYSKCGRCWELRRQLSQTSSIVHDRRVFEHHLAKVSRLILEISDPNNLQCLP